MLDVKAGAGAFMKTREDARALAESLVAIGNASGVRTEALVTAMDAPLGREGRQCHRSDRVFETLKGRGPADLEELSVALAARMLVARRGRAMRAPRGGRAVRARAAVRAGLETFRASSNIRAATPESWTTMPGCRRRPIGTASRRRASGYRVRRCTRSWSAGRRWRSAPAAAAGRRRRSRRRELTVLAPPGATVRAWRRVFACIIAAAAASRLRPALARQAVRIGP